MSMNMATDTKSRLGKDIQCLWGWLDYFTIVFKKA